MTLLELVHQRLNNQQLWDSNVQKPVDVVRWFGAVHAQDFNAAKWAIALRILNATNAAIESAFNKGQIIRTHVLRPTWHFVAPADIRWLLELTAPRVNIRCGPNYRKYELDGPTFKRANKVLTKALRDGKCLTRSELKTALNRASVAAEDLIRLAHILIRAELDGVVCSGPRIGKQFTYALLEERVTPAKRMNRDEALATLTQRYFTSHGPATLQDFVWWSGLTASDARDGISLVESVLDKDVVNEKVYWSGRRAPFGRSAASSPASARLLPAYDEYNVAYKDRQVVLDLDDDGKSAMATWGMLGPTVMIDGKIVGAWKASIDKNSLTIAINPSRPLKRRETRAILNAATQYASFVGLPADVHI
jgi:hypothetical protein